LSAGRLIAGLLLAAGPLLPQASVVPLKGKLGEVWKVSDWMRPAFDFHGTWTRRERTNIFVMRYQDRLKKSAVATETVTIESIVGANFRARLASGKILTGTIQRDGRTIKGQGEWCKGRPVCGFEIVTDWEITPELLAAVRPEMKTERAPVRTREEAEKLLGKLWRVHDQTMEGLDYTGTWTLDLDRKVIRFLYREAKGGAADGALRLTGIVEDEILIYNPGRRKNYRGKLSADGKTITGTADWCPEKKRACTWTATIQR